jgi:hypothetical protein
MAYRRPRADRQGIAADGLKTTLMHQDGARRCAPGSAIRGCGPVFLFLFHNVRQRTVGAGPLVENRSTPIGMAEE